MNNYDKINSKLMGYLLQILIEKGNLSLYKGN